MNFKKKIGYAIVIGVMPFTTIITGDQPQQSSSWWSTYLPTLSRPSWMSWPSAETTAAVKDYIKAGLVGSAGALASFVAGSRIAQLSPESDLSKLVGLSVLGGLSAAGVASYYFWYSTRAIRQKFNQIKSENITVKNLQELRVLLKNIQNLEKELKGAHNGTWSSQILWIEQELQKIKARVVKYINAMVKAEDYQDEYTRKKAYIKNKPLEVRYALYIYDPIKYIGLLTNILESEQLPVDHPIQQVRDFFENELRETLDAFGKYEDIKKELETIAKEIIVIENQFMKTQGFSQNEVALLLGSAHEEIQRINERIEHFIQLLQSLEVTAEQATILDDTIKILQEWLKKLERLVSTVQNRSISKVREPHDIARPIQVPEMDIAKALNVLKEGLDLEQDKLTKSMINNAFKTLSLKYHPDRSAADPGKIIAINNVKEFFDAYFVQKEEDIQKAYKQLQSTNLSESKEVIQQEIEQEPLATNVPLLQIEYPGYSKE